MDEDDRDFSDITDEDLVVILEVLNLILTTEPRRGLFLKGYND